MTTEQIERLASEGAEVPDDMSLSEQLLFLTLRELYSNYHNGAVNRERARKEKQKILVAYDYFSRDRKATENHLEIRKRLSGHIVELLNCGCPHCKKLINIFVGIDRKDIPEDAKMLHAQNERLRDLVQERSERNAELANIIDRARRALEKEDYERAREVLSQ